jgi:hypothetical protein
MAWLSEMFGVSKPIIAMAHLPALPGTPLYSEKSGVQGIVDSVAKDLKVLLGEGVHGIMFCNEGDRPYALRADFEAVAVMTAVVTQLAPRDRPFGVDFLWDAKAPIAIAKATGAHFVREVFTGVYESDMGLWAPDAAALLRYRRAIDAQNVRLLFNVVPEFASPLGSRTTAMLARSAVVSSLADAILVSGPMAGAAASISALREARDAVPADVPVIANTGVRADNVEEYLEIADGAIVGSYFKEDGYTWNPVDAGRVRALMSVVHRLNKRLH